MPQKTKTTTTTAEAMSTNDQLDSVRGAFGSQFNGDGTTEYCYCEDIFLTDGYLICEMGGAYYRVDFSKKDGAWSFTGKADWKKMEQTYTPAGESRRTNYFAERVDLREAEVDETNYVVKGVTLIKPGFSVNTDKAGRPRYYPKATLEAACKVFEGTRMFFNHPSRSAEKDLPERDVRDIGGYYKDVHAAADGRLLGDLHLVRSKEITENTFPLIVQAVNEKPDLVELSINALGQTYIGEAEGRKAVVVESIVASNSVDLVTTGAAGGSFAGALLASDGQDMTRELLGAMTFDEWRAARPDYIAQLKGEWKTVRETDAVKTAKSDLDEANKTIQRLEEANRADVDELAKYRRADLADRLLSESGLPHPLRAKVRPELLEATDEGGMKAILEREKDKYKVAPKAPVAVTGAGQRPAPQAQDITEARPSNPVATLLGVSEAARPLPGEDAEQYRRRMRKA